MNERKSPYTEIRQILAADQRCGEVTPQDDQIWELNTARGEPPAVALQTTYGLRAYGMRVFPRFVYKKIPISDPRAFAIRPVLEFSAPNFISLTYSPITSVDVTQKVWVPDSHTLVSQITINNNTDALIQLGMEWVVMLNPMISGSSMTATQISVNTVLQGLTQHLRPVFFLTGGPQSNLSAFPSLGIELSLVPHSSRQFSWALASLDSVDSSFYGARKSTAYSLDNEQIKIEMLQKQQTIDFGFPEPHQTSYLQQSQQRIYQLLLPPWRKFNHVSYVNNRLPDQGSNPSDKGMDFSSGWGVQRIHEIWEVSRIMLPICPKVVSDLVQNLLDQQGNDGTIYAQTSWNGKITGLPAAPLLVSLILDIFDSTSDLLWLSRIYPALIQSTRIWFKSEQEYDSDLFPTWSHLLQTGIAESTILNPQIKTQLKILIETAEWPSLYALLVQECQGLIRIANLLGDTTEISWLEEKIQCLHTKLHECWDDQHCFYLFHDKENHLAQDKKILHTFKQDGSVETQIHFSDPVRLCVKVHLKNSNLRTVECQIKGVVKHHEKTFILPAKKFQWEDEDAFLVTEEMFSTIKQISVTGLKKGDQLTVETPDYTLMSPDFLIPLWAGIPADEQAQKMILRGVEYMDAPNLEIPTFLKIMWLEGLNRYNFKELACRFYQKWFFSTLSESTHPHDYRELSSRNLSGASLHNLPPLKTLLQLLGVQKMSADELLVKDFNEFFPKVNVQYKKLQLVLEAMQIKIEDLNGENVLITEPGTHRIVLS